MSDAPTNAAYRFGKRRTFVVVSGLLLGLLLAALNQTIVSTALPRIVADLGGFEHYSWVFSAYMLGATVTVPLYGKLSDIYGRRPFFALAIVFFMAGAVVSGTAQSMGQLIAGRAIQGIGAGGLVPLAMAVIGDLVAPRERGKWQSVTGAVFGVASVVGPATGGWISDNTSWRWAFFVSLPFGLIALAVVWLGFRLEPEHREHRVDYAGAALLTAGVSSGLLATVWGGVEYPWGSPQVEGLYLVSALLLAAFIRQERRAADPILPLGLFRSRTFAAAQVALFMIGAALFGTIMFIPLFVQGVLGRSATNSGAVLTPLILGFIVAGVAAGQIASRTGRYKAILLASPLVTGIGFVLLTQLGVNSTSGEATPRHGGRRRRRRPRHADVRVRRPERRATGAAGRRDGGDPVLAADRRDDRGNGDGRALDDAAAYGAGRALDAGAGTRAWERVARLARRRGRRAPPGGRCHPAPRGPRRRHALRCFSSASRWRSPRLSRPPSSSNASCARPWPRSRPCRRPWPTS